VFQTYAPNFIEDVGLKQKLAESEFSHLFKFDKLHAGNGK
jgi:hypothetical protein